MDDLVSPWWSFSLIFIETSSGNDARSESGSLAIGVVCAVDGRDAAPNAAAAARLAPIATFASS